MNVLAMIKYTVAQAKRDFDMGYLTQWHIDRAPLGRGWFVHLGSGNGRGVLVDTRSQEPRHFKSLDGAVSVVEGVGFEVNALYQGS